MVSMKMSVFWDVALCTRWKFTDAQMLEVISTFMTLHGETSQKTVIFK
jgi:hypothetical protein